MATPTTPPPPSGPFPFLRPTIHYHLIPSAEPTEPIYHVWRSRDNRKGRHAALIPPQPTPATAGRYPRPTSTLAETTRGIAKMFTSFPVWDVSYDVAVVFTLGCVVWVINGFFVWYPLAAPWSEFSGETDVGGGWTAFVGATIFEVGSVLLMLEAVNENHTECFGWALEEAIEDHSLRLRTLPEKCHHHHSDKTHWIRQHPPSQSRTALAADTPSPSTDTKTSTPQQLEFTFLPSLSSLKTTYLPSLGFLACLSQLLGATIFWISGLTALPSINSALSTPASNGIYWLPQVIGGTGFIISSLLFMVEVQEKWWRPAPGLLGWHVGFWNLVGAVGFTLCGALGFGVEEGGEGVEYALALATFLGSWAFLIGSVVQWYESLDKYPVSVGKVPS